jgi:hypothetical protein
MGSEDPGDRDPLRTCSAGSKGEYTTTPAARPEAGDWTLPIPRLTLELFLRSRDRTLVEHYLGPSDLPLVRRSISEEFEELGWHPTRARDPADRRQAPTAEEIAAKAPPTSSRSSSCWRP